MAEGGYQGWVRYCSFIWRAIVESATREGVGGCENGKYCATKRLNGPTWKRRT